MAGKDRIPSQPASKVKMVKMGKTKSLQQKLDSFRVVERPVTDTSSEPGDFHDQSHDHDHPDQPDLEAVIMHDGTEWADAPEIQTQNQISSRSYAEVASPKLTNASPRICGNPDMAVGRSVGLSTPPPFAF